MKRYSRISLGLVVFLAAVVCVLGVLFGLPAGKSFVRNQLEQTASGYFILNMYRNAFHRITDPSHITYSIFDRDYSARHIEDRKIREAMPEFSVIKGLDINDSSENRAMPAMAFNSWHRSHADSYSSKYSELDQINSGNIQDLVPAWTFHSGEGSWQTNVETNPIIVGQNLFVTTPADFLVSINATTGVENWRTAIPLPARRGLLWWPGNARHSPRLYVPSINGVYAIDPTNGQVIKKFGSDGHVGSTMSLVAPAIDGDRLIVATVAPSVEAYDVESGKFLWKTSLLKSEATSSARPRDFSLSGSWPWGGFSLDSARSKIYVSTGNPRPTLYGVKRPGRNDYSSSVVAIDTISGQIKWSFQEVAHDLWDLDVPSPPVLVKIRRQNRTIDAVAVVTKIGNTLLLDRDNGKPIFDFRFRRAPTSKVPGEQTWPYQPAVELPEPFAEQEFKPSDITDIGDSEKATVEAKLKDAEFGFFVPPSINGKAASFDLHGGAEWPGAAADQEAGILYVPSNRYPWILRLHYVDMWSNPVRSVDKIADALYQTKCAGCHGVEREGYYENEFVGDKAYPSLVGITASRNITGTEWFRKIHRRA